MTDSVYPIKCKLVGDAELLVEIVEISQKGIRVDSVNSPLVVNKSFVAHFTFPGSLAGSEVSVVVSRVYAEINSDPAAKRKTKLMNELLFKKPSAEFNNLLVKFLGGSAHR